MSKKVLIDLNETFKDDVYNVITIISITQIT